MRRRMIRGFWMVACAALALLAAAPASAASRLFTDEAPLTLVITAPFGDLVRTAKTKINVYPATLAVTEGSSPPLTLSIQLSARGVTRRTGGYCDFPPVALRF